MGKSGEPFFVGSKFIIDSCGQVGPVCSACQADSFLSPQTVQDQQEADWLYSVWKPWHVCCFDFKDTLEGRSTPEIDTK